MLFFIVLGIMLVLCAHTLIKQYKNRVFTGGK